MAKSTVNDDLFELNDVALEAKFQHLDKPIGETVQESRELQRSADFKRDSISLENLVEGWFVVGEEKFLPNRSQNLTYASNVATRYGVTGEVPTSTFGVAEPVASKRSKII